MTKYLVKYTVTFIQQNISVSDEMEVEDGQIYFNADKENDLKVTDEKGAEGYVLSLYSDNEDNVIIIPQSIWDSKDGLTDTELSIESVSKID